MTEFDKKSLSERDICTKFITPAIAQANWNVMTQVREEVTLTDGRVIVRGKLTARDKKKRADYILYHFRPGRSCHDAIGAIFSGSIPLFN